LTTLKGLLVKYLIGHSAESGNAYSRGGGGVIGRGGSSLKNSRGHGHGHGFGFGLTISPLVLVREFQAHATPLISSESGLSPLYDPLDNATHFIVMQWIM
jgi:hypothetical protein